jgi:hypothetical protein
MNQVEQATNAIIERAQAEGDLARKYARVFGSKEGQEVLADIAAHFPNARARFDAPSTKANPVAALIGGIHFDGSAAVTSYILDRIEAAKAPAETVPTVSAP